MNEVERAQMMLDKWRGLLDHAQMMPPEMERSIRMVVSDMEWIVGGDES